MIFMITGRDFQGGSSKFNQFKVIWFLNTIFFFHFIFKMIFRKWVTRFVDLCLLIHD